MQFITTIISSILAIVFFLSATLEASWEDVAEYARENFPLSGQLLAKTGQGGYLYLKVDDSYSTALFHLLDIEKDDYKQFDGTYADTQIIADIRVTNAGEYILPKEIGRTFNFEVDKFEIKQCDPLSWDIILIITSPELDKFRQNYGLGPKKFYMRIANLNYYLDFS